MTKTFALLSAGLLAAVGAVVACTSAPSVAPRPVTVPPPAVDAAKPADYAGLHNVVAYGPALYSGSVPEGDAGFESLADMGIRTIISVDGAVPEAVEAEERGMRYVHLPISYGGIDEERRLEIARAVRDLPGPIYVHCHHGKHRSAGASAAAAVLLGRLDNDQALARMKVSGTSADYKGLYACATETHHATDAEISRASDEFPSQWRTSSFVDAMVEIDEVNDELKAIEKAQFGVPKDHPDLVPSHVAARLENLLRAREDDPYTKAQPAGFHTMMKASTQAAQELEDGIVANEPADKLAPRMKTLAQSCKACHVKYRD